MKQKSQDVITKDMKIESIVEKYPDVIPILLGYGLHCVGCHFSGFDTLENGAKIHGMDNETLSMLVKDLNDFLREINS